jgi:hypothetical protein
MEPSIIGAMMSLKDSGMVSYSVLHAAKGSDLHLWASMNARKVLSNADFISVYTVEIFPGFMLQVTCNEHPSLKGQ